MTIRLDCLNEYSLIQKLGEGTFSNVFKVQKLETKEFFAMKIMRKKFNTYEEADNFDEIVHMRMIGNHDNILKLHDVIYEPTIGRLSLVLDLMEFNLLQLMQSPHWLAEDISYYMYQLCLALTHIHDLGLMHRDVKPENILISLKTRNLKLGDLGSIVEYPTENHPGEYVSTRWYRPPELLLKAPTYSKEIDTWATACVVAEMILKKPLFAGHNTIEQLRLIHSLLGPPSEDLLREMEADARYKGEMFSSDEKKDNLEDLLKDAPEEVRNYLSQMLKYNPGERTLVEDLIIEPYFLAFEGQKKLTKGRQPVMSTPTLGLGKAIPRGNSLNAQRTIAHEAPDFVPRRGSVSFPAIAAPKTAAGRGLIPERLELKRLPKL